MRFVVWNLSIELRCCCCSWWCRTCGARLRIRNSLFPINEFNLLHIANAPLQFMKRMIYGDWLVKLKKIKFRHNLKSNLTPLMCLESNHKNAYQNAIYFNLYHLARNISDSSIKTFDSGPCNLISVYKH